MSHTIASGAPAPTVPSVFTVQESSLVLQAFRLDEAERLKDSPVLCYYEDFRRYLVLRFGGLLVEEFHVLYLDTDHRLVAAESIAVGDQKSVSPNLRHVAYRAIGLGADAVVFAHNHPNDSPTPSDNDLRHLQWAEKALGWLNITVLDSYVVTSKRITSIKDYRRQQEEEARRRSMAEYDRRSAERRAKIAATKTRKAAERAAQIQGEAA